MCKVNGADMMYTEFISSEGLISRRAKSVMKTWIYFEYERPTGIQLFGSELNLVIEAAEIAEQAQPILLTLIMAVRLKLLRARSWRCVASGYPEDGEHDRSDRQSRQTSCYRQNPIGMGW